MLTANALRVVYYVFPLCSSGHRRRRTGRNGTRVITVRVEKKKPLYIAPPAYFFPSLVHITGTRARARIITCYTVATRSKGARRFVYAVAIGCNGFFIFENKLEILKILAKPKRFARARGGGGNDYPSFTRL